MAINQFLPFAIDPAAPVLNNASYAASSPTLGRGPGVVPKEHYNKTTRQATVMAAAVGQFILGQGFDALDDGNVPALTAALLDAIRAAAGAVVSVPQSVIAYNNSQSVFALTANLALTEGTWLVDGLCSALCSTFPEMYFSINGNIVQTQPNFGDPEGIATSTLGGFATVVIPPGGASVPISFTQQSGGNSNPLFVRAIAHRVA